MKKITLVIIYLLGLLITGLLALVFLWPEYLVYLKLSAVQAKILIVFVISFVLLLNSFASNLSSFWKILCAVLSLIVLAEFVLMNNWWQVLIK